MYQPLADILRPQTLDEVYGQAHILGEGAILRRLVDSGNIPNMIFYGPSGTGKTTLSTDPKRLLIGDDEHGWDEEGVFNYEGGCYAKVINLDKESEPDIYNAIRRDALLENVTVAEDGKINFADKSVTENTRVSYPINFINNIVKPISKGPHAHQVIFLSADAFGVLPPVSILNPEQAQYYFLSGFTSKLAGTERGITAPGKLTPYPMVSHTRTLIGIWYSSISFRSSTQNGMTYPKISALVISSR